MEVAVIGHAMEVAVIGHAMGAAGLVAGCVLFVCRLHSSMNRRFGKQSRPSSRMSKGIVPPGCLKNKHVTCDFLPQIKTQNHVI